MQAWQAMRCGMCKWFVCRWCNNKDMDAMVSGGGGMMRGPKANKICEQMSVKGAAGPSASNPIDNWGISFFRFCRHNASRTARSRGI
jgi:hypothetical protein